MTSMAATSSILAGSTVFIGASIPDANRWTGSYDPYAITDAVVATARCILASGGRIVSGAHPTIAPLLLYVAAEGAVRSVPQVTIYQSELYRDILPDAVRHFESSRVGRVTHTTAVAGDTPNPGASEASLLKMRTQMLCDEPVSAAVFIGGMDGIKVERDLFEQLLPDRPWYAIKQPGGCAADMKTPCDSSLQKLLMRSHTYPTVARAIVADIVRRQH